MKIFIYTLPLVLIISCNVPEDKRARRSRTNTELESDIYSRNRTTYIPPQSAAGSSSTGEDDKSVIDSGPTSSTTQDNSSNFPKMKNNCTFSKDGLSNFNNGLSAHLGSQYNLCQSADNPNTLYFQLKRPIKDVPICFVPTHNYGQKSVYIGEPRCRVISSNTTIYKIELFANRKNYSNISITGVMIMKDIYLNFSAPFAANKPVKIPDAYIYCSEYLDQYGDPSYCLAFRNKAEYIYNQF